jgi:hypothetical protein
MPEPARAGKIARPWAARQDLHENPVETPPRSRVVLLGASNLTLAFSLVVSRLRAVLPGPLEVLAAIGHGRSYGRPSRVLFRQLPGIAECGLWRILDRGPKKETFALLADFGNDLMYGQDVDEIVGWIERILERLASQGARSALARLPLSSIERLTPLRFGIARGLLYPSHRIDLATVRERARALDERIVALAQAHGAALVEPRGDWYGLDPIHIRWSRRGEAWDELLSPLGMSAAPGTFLELDGAERRALRRVRPERRRWMGRQETHPQPCAVLLDGTTISVY